MALKIVHNVRLRSPNKSSFDAPHIIDLQKHAEHFLYSAKKSFAICFNCSSSSTDTTRKTPVFVPDRKRWIVNWSNGSPKLLAQTIR